jgi:WD40 repeat protein
VLAKGRVYDLKISKNDNFILTAHNTGYVYIHSMEDLELIGKFKDCENEVNFVCITFDCQTIITGNRNGQVNTYNVEIDQPITVLETGKDPIQKSILLKKAKNFAIIKDNTVKVYNTETLEKVHLEKEYPGMVQFYTASENFNSSSAFVGS